MQAARCGDIALGDRGARRHELLGLLDTTVVQLYPLQNGATGQIHVFSGHPELPHDPRGRPHDQNAAVAAPGEIRARNVAPWRSESGRIWGRPPTRAAAHARLLWHRLYHEWLWHVCGRHNPSGADSER